MGMQIDSLRLKKSRRELKGVNDINRIPKTVYTEYKQWKKTV